MTINRIYLNKSLWITFQPDKLIFGGDFLKEGFHFTLPYGVKSKIVDLHITKDNRHYPIFFIRHENLLPVLTFLAPRFFSSFVINPKVESFETISKKFNKVVYLQGLDKENEDKFGEEIQNQLINLKSSPESKKIRIDEEKPAFKEFVENLKENNSLDFSEKELSTIKDKDDCSCFLINDNNTSLLYKKGNTYLVFEAFEFDLKKVVQNTFSENIIKLVQERIEEGIQVIENENFENIIDDYRPFEIKLK
ncbi:MAG: hypothetical protein AB7S48_16325 [Bacteroidales bacterium]